MYCDLGNLLWDMAQLKGECLRVVGASFCDLSVCTEEKQFCGHPSRAPLVNVAPHYSGMFMDSLFHRQPTLTIQLYQSQCTLVRRSC